MTAQPGIVMPEPAAETGTATPDRPLRDIHPATVQLPDGTRLTRTRTRIYPDRLEIWEAVGRTPTLTHQLPVTEVVLADPHHPNAAITHTVHTTDGTAAIARDLTGCNCHSPLAGMRL